MCVTSNEVRRGKASPKKIEPARVRIGIEELDRRLAKLCVPPRPDEVTTPCGSPLAERISLLRIVYFALGCRAMAVVLVVEDEDQVRVLAESCLQEHGHKTLSASTIPEALALLDSKEPIDVLFTDIGLKGEIHAGLELAKEAVKHRPDLKVLYTTGQGVTDGMRALFVVGFAFLAKPYFVDQLLTCLIAHFGYGTKSAKPR